MREEIFITGIGGQGIVLAGEIIAKAAIKKNYYTVMTKMYGAEVRGGASSSGVIISDTRIYYPFVRKPDFILALHQKGLLAHAPRRTRFLVIDEDLVKDLDNIKYERIIKLPILRMAEKVGGALLSNMVLLGIYARLSSIISLEDLITIIKKETKEAYRDLNVKAIKYGYETLHKLF
ncbi:MAG: 2-oxoacid:acceptor oxidoreductase family protein [Candidatus Njordarchaeales archaeon]